MIKLLEDYISDIKEILKNTVMLDKDIETIDVNENLYNLGLDSINCVNFALEVERHFQVVINDEDIIEDNFFSISNLIKLLKDKYL